jgi:hypothetical protein
MLVAMTTRGEYLRKFLPQRAQDFLYEHGREAASAVSLTRIAHGLGCAALTLSGKRGVGPALINASLEIGDGLDGEFARFDKDFGNVRTEIHDRRKLVGELGKTIAGVGHPFRKVLRAIDGAWLDQNFDKFAQTARQISLAATGRMAVLHPIIAFARNKATDEIRTTYKELGVKNSGGALLPGKAKTALMAVGFIAESTGVLEPAPKVRDGIFALGSLATIASGAHLLYTHETDYLSQNGYDTTVMGIGERLAIGAARVLTHQYPNIEITPTHHVPIEDAAILP